MAKMLTIVAVGALAGKSGLYGGFNFVDGKTQVMSDRDDNIRMLGAFYNAHPEGSDEHKAAQAHIDAEEAKSGVVKKAAPAPVIVPPVDEDEPVVTPPSAPPPVTTKMTVAEIQELGQEHFGVELTGSKAEMIEKYNELLSSKE